MKTYFYLTFLIVGLFFSNCEKSEKRLQNEATVELKNTLLTLSKSAILFGHQDDLAYGVGWKGLPGESDVKRTCGDYPALFGWEIGNIGDSCNLDGVCFDSMVVYIQRVHQMGGINTISWHAQYPVTGTDAWTKTNIDVPEILPGGKHHQLFIQRLDLVADFLNQLRDVNGELIPVLFRPWHEMMGDWFWWGSSSCTDEAYIELYRFTVNYLQKKKKLCNLIMVYSPDGGISSREAYLARYPGDEYIDVLGIDNYGDFTRNRLDIIVQQISIIVDLATEKNKIPALTETGSDRLSIQNWYTTNLLQVLKANEKTSRLAYVMVWRNRDTDHFYVPYRDHEQANDFKMFVNDKMIYLLNDYNNWKESLPEKQ